MLKKMVVYCALTWCLLGRPCVAENQRGSTNAANQHTRENQSVTPPAGKIVDPLVSSPCSKDKPCYTQNATAEKSLPWFIRPEWVIVYVTVIYAFITWLSLSSIKRQADTMERQAADAREANAASAKTTRRTLKALTMQGLLMERQAKAQEIQNQALRDKERARLTFVFPPAEPDLSHSWSFENEDGAEEFFMSVKLALHNDGPTKAFGVRAKGSILTQLKDESFVSDTLQEISIPDVIRDVPIDNPIDLTIEVMLPAKEADAVSNAERDLYVYGEITYKDFQGMGHTTPFRFLWAVNDYYDGDVREFNAGWVNQSPQST